MKKTLYQKINLKLKKFNIMNIKRDFYQEVYTILIQI